MTSIADPTATVAEKPGMGRSDYYTPDDLRRDVTLVPKAHFPDGDVYAVRSLSARK